MNTTNPKRETPSLKNLVAIYIGLIVTAALIFGWLWKVRPAILESIASEEGLIESLTALFLGSSFVLSIILIIKLRQLRLGLVYLGLPLLSLLTFLDEVSYGLRFFNFQTFSIFGIQIDGLHDIFIILSIQIQRTPYYFQMAGFIVLAITLIFIVSMIAKDIWLNLTRYRMHLLRGAGLLLFVITLISLVYLLSIPSDLKNAWILGYSPVRILMAAAFLFAVLLVGWFTLRVWRNQRWAKNIATTIDHLREKPTRRYLTITLLTLICVIGSIIFGMVNNVISPQARFYAYTVRLLPLVLWLTLTAGMLLFLFLIWGQDSPKSFSIFVKSVFRFFQSYPAYQFVIVAIAFAACAQSIDIDLFNFPRADLLEEILEFFASISLLFATFCIRIPPILVNSATKNGQENSF